MKIKVLLVILLLSFPDNPAMSDSDHTITLGTVENLPPFSYYENGILSGIDIEVMRVVEGISDVTFNIRPLPWARVIAELQNGSLEGAFSLYEKEERKKYCRYIAVMHFDNLGMVADRKKAFAYGNIRDLYGKRVIKGMGVYISADFEKAEKEKNIAVDEIYDTDMSNIRMLIAGRADAAIGVVETLEYYAKKLGYSNDIVQIENLIEKKRAGYLVFSLKASISDNKQLSSRIAHSVESFMRSPEYEKIVNKYIAEIR